MTDPAPTVKPSKRKAVYAGIGGGIFAAAIVVFIMFFPMIPITVTETYETTQTRNVNSPEMLGRQEQILSVDDYELTPENPRYVISGFVNSGHQVVFSGTATDPVDANIQYSNGSPAVNGVNSENFRLGFTAPVDDTYYFSIQNPDKGFLDTGFNAQPIHILQATATESWEELVTKPTVITEPVTEEFTTTKTVSIIDILMGTK